MCHAVNRNTRMRSLSLLSLFSVHFLRATLPIFDGNVVDIYKKVIYFGSGGGREEEEEVKVNVMITIAIL